MTLVDMIKDMDILPNDVIDYVLLDFIVGDKKYWKMKFDKCINAINDLSSLYVKARNFEEDHEVDMVLVIQFYCMEKDFNHSYNLDTDFGVCYRNNVIPLPRLRDRIIYMKYDINMTYDDFDSEDFDSDDFDDSDY